MSDLDDLIPKLSDRQIVGLCRTGAGMLGGHIQLPVGVSRDRMSTPQVGDVVLEWSSCLAGRFQAAVCGKALGVLLAVDATGFEIVTFERRRVNRRVRWERCDLIALPVRLADLARRATE